MRELLEKWAADGHEMAIQAIDLPHSDEIMIDGHARDGVVFIYQPNGEFFVAIGEGSPICRVLLEQTTTPVLRTGNVALAVKTMIELNTIIKAAKDEAKAVAK